MASVCGAARVSVRAVDRRDFLAKAGTLAAGSWVVGAGSAITGCARTVGAGGEDEAAGANDATTQPGSAAHGGEGSAPEVFEIDASWPDVPSSCAERGQANLVVDLQLHAGFVHGNPFGIVSDPRIYYARPETYPWLDLEALPLHDIETLAQLVLGESGTTVAVFGTWPYSLPSTPGAATIGTNNDELLANVRSLEARFPRRVFAQFAVMPNDRIEDQLVMMDRLAVDCVMWRLQTEWSPTRGDGFFLDDEVGARVLMRGIELGAPIFSVHKGKSLPGASFQFTSPRDIGPAANAFREAHLVVCNAAFEHGLDSTQTSAPDLMDSSADLGWGPGVGEWPEGPYDDQDSSVSDKYPLTRGVNSLIKSLRDAGIGPNGTRLDGADGPITHVYATCGAAWPCLMPRPVEAMHFWGKLLKHLGEDRVLWSTESPWFGSPSVLLAAFQAFEISEALQQRYGYPALTPTIKAKILGHNAVHLFGARGLTLDGCHDDFATPQAPPDTDADAGMIGSAGAYSRRSLLGLRAPLAAV
jgi:hypothetical protein